LITEESKLKRVEALLEDERTHHHGHRSELEDQLRQQHEELLAQDNQCKHVELLLEEERSKLVAAESEIRRSERQCHEISKARDIVGSTAEQAELRLHAKN
jgi:hypothetical protein